MQRSVYHSTNSPNKAPVESSLDYNFWRAPWLHFYECWLSFLSWMKRPERLLFVVLCVSVVLLQKEARWTYSASLLSCILDHSPLCGDHALPFLWDVSHMPNVLVLAVLSISQIKQPRSCSRNQNEWQPECSPDEQVISIKSYRTRWKWRDREEPAILC